MHIYVPILFQSRIMPLQYYRSDFSAIVMIVAVNVNFYSGVLSKHMCIYIAALFKLLLG